MAATNPLLINTSNSAQLGPQASAQNTSAQLNGNKSKTAGVVNNEAVSASQTAKNSQNQTDTKYIKRQGDTPVASDSKVNGAVEPSDAQEFRPFREHLESELNGQITQNTPFISSNTPTFAANGQGVATGLLVDAAGLSQPNGDSLQIGTLSRLSNQSNTAREVMTAAQMSTSSNPKSLTHNVLKISVGEAALKLEGSVKSDGTSNLQVLPTVSASTTTANATVAASTSIDTAATKSITSSTTNYITALTSTNAAVSANTLASSDATSGISMSLDSVARGESGKVQEMLKAPNSVITTQTNAMTNMAASVSTVNSSTSGILANPSMASNIASTSMDSSPVANQSVSVEGNTTLSGTPLTHSSQINTTSVDSLGLSGMSPNMQSGNAGMQNQTLQSNLPSAESIAKVDVSLVNSASSNANQINAVTTQGIAPNALANNTANMQADMNTGAVSSSADLSKIAMSADSANASNQSSVAGATNTIAGTTSTATGLQGPSSGLSNTAKTDFSDILNSLDGHLGEHSGEDSSEESIRPTLNRITATPAGLANVSYRMVDGQPVATTFMPTTFGQPSWSEQVASQVAWFSSKNVREAEIQLDPPELGSLQVRVTMSQDQASVSFTSPNASVREALDQSVARLREMFNEQQIDLVDVDVSGQSHDESLAQESQFAQEGDASSTDSDDQNSATSPDNVSTVTVQVKEGLVREVV